MPASLKPGCAPAFITQTMLQRLVKHSKKGYTFKACCPHLPLYILSCPGPLQHTLVQPCCAYYNLELTA